MRKIILFLVFIPSFCLADGSELNYILDSINDGFARSYQSTERIGDNVNIIRQIAEDSGYNYNQIITSLGNLYYLLQVLSASTTKESTLSAAKSTLDSIKTVLQNRLDGYFPDFAEYLSDISASVSGLSSSVAGLASESSLSHVMNSVDSIDCNLAFLTGLDFASDSTLQSVDSKLSNLDQLVDIYYKLDELSKDNTLLEFSNSFNVFNNEWGNFSTGLLYSLADLSISVGSFEGYLSSIDGKLSTLDNLYFLDQLSYLSTLAEKDFATETTLQAVLSAIEGLSSDSSDVDLSELATEETLLDLSTFIQRQDFFASSDFDNVYADIGFASNSVAQQVQLSYSSDDFFSAAISLLSDGNKIEGSVTRFLKHINDKMPKAVDTSSDESRISSSIDDASSQLDSVKSSFDFTSNVSFRDDASGYFDYSSLFSSLPDSDSLPTMISIKFPSFMGSQEHYFEIPTSSLSDFFDVSRACFSVLYFVLVSGFVWYLFKLFIPVMLRFSKLLATVLNW